MSERSVVSLTPDPDLARARARRGVLRTLVVVVSVAIAVAAGAPTALRHLRAARLLAGVGGHRDPTGLSDLVLHRVGERRMDVPISGRSLRAIAYEPSGAPGAPGAVLLHGVHPQGFAEPHLRAFAHDLAATGMRVLTPELPELLDYRVEPTTIDDIARCAEHHARITGAPVGVWGISFAGGLALLAAALARSDHAIAYVVAIGAHHDLRRLARYYAGGDVRAPDGSRPSVRPHPYGGRAMLLAHAEDVFPPAGVDAARRALRAWLAGRIGRARREAVRAEPATRAVLEVLFDDRRRDEAATILVHAAEERAAELATVSPAGRLRGLRVPVFLIHGRDDPVIPSIETLHLAREIPAESLRGVLVTPVLRHTDSRVRASFRDQWALVRLVAGVFAQARE